MKRRFLFLILLLCGLFMPLELAHSQEQKLQPFKTDIVFDDIAVQKNHYFYVYLNVPNHLVTVSPSISVYKPGEYDKPRSKSLVTRLAGVSEDWIRQEFRVPEKGWPSLVTVVLTIESESPDFSFLWSAIRVLVLSSDTPIGLGELHESTFGFRFNPPNDSAADSGRFFYYVPWEASVVISILRVVPKKRPEALNISIREPSKKGPATAFTIWDGKAFKTLPDGIYGALVVYTQLNAPEAKPLKLWIPFTLERNTK